MKVAGLFSGVGGIELGLQRAGHEILAVGDIDPFAVEVLTRQFPDAALHGDVKALRKLPSCEILVAGFPCQDLSQAGRTTGITGPKSGVVSALFQLLAGAEARPDWLVIENVPFMLSLQGGSAIEFLTSALEDLNYRWAYRVVDTLAFGLPQRRRRVVLVASQSGDPKSVLLGSDCALPRTTFSRSLACGFYWTEGNTGLGWAIDAVPPLKGGSALGIPSPPAIWSTKGTIITPDIKDAERLQGFPADWTLSTEDRPERQRWRLVGNAVSVPVFEWVGQLILAPSAYKGDLEFDRPPKDLKWPNAAYGEKGRVQPVAAGPWPVIKERAHLEDFLLHQARPLSLRATSGFYERARKSKLALADGFLEALAAHIEAQRQSPSATDKAA